MTRSQPIYRTNSTDLQFHEEDQKDADIVFRDMYNIFKERAFYLKEHQNHTDGKLKPRVRLMRKTLSDSQGLQISCLATGFYPRHINLTLFRDGQPVEDDLITGGQILPNGDGTYQMRKSLVISEEELREEHKYNCTMKHLNLETKLDIQYGKEKKKKCHNRFNNKNIFISL
uniref:Ig-like domain-containing protein n=1 Tax=Cyprinus carpio TaxID=7962 RepID=A0A8C1VRT6_CYPCA